MTSWSRLFGLTAWVFCAAGAGAQEPPAPAQPEATGTGIEALPRDVPWDTIIVDWTEPRYKIEALRFKARDESGADWPGSDEVMVTTQDPEGNPDGWTVSEEIGDIDSGDTHEFDPAASCVLAVRPGVALLGKTSVCDEAGAPAPLRFMVEMWEKDDGIAVFPGAGIDCKVLPPSAAGHAGPHCANDGEGDDFLGRARIELSAQELEAALPQVGAELVQTVVLFPCGDNVGACAGWFLPDYSFTFRVTRLPDARTDFKSELEAAMRRSGARFETEAVVSGLRSLRAPAPRRIEPDSGDGS
jgi:hypothetical protein